MRHKTCGRGAKESEGITDEHTFDVDRLGHRRPRGSRSLAHGFVLAGRRSLYLRLAIAIWCGGVLLGILRTVIGLGRLVRIRAQATEVPPWVVAQGASCPRTRPQERLRDSDARPAVTLPHRPLEADDPAPRAAMRGRCSRRSCLRSSPTSSHICYGATSHGMLSFMGYRSCSGRIPWSGGFASRTPTRAMPWPTR